MDSAVPEIDLNRTAREHAAALRVGEYTSRQLTEATLSQICLLYTSPSPRDGLLSRMPSSA